MNQIVEHEDNVVSISDSIRPHPCQSYAVVGIDGIECNNNAQYVVDGDIALCGRHAEEVVSSE